MGDKNPVVLNYMPFKVGSVKTFAFKKCILQLLSLQVVCVLLNESVVVSGIHCVSNLCQEK